MFTIQNVFHKFLLMKTCPLLHDSVYSVWIYLPLVIINDSSRWNVTDKLCTHNWRDDCNSSCTFSDTPACSPLSLRIYCSFQPEYLRERGKRLSSALLGSELGSCKLNLQTIDQQVKTYKFYFMLIFLPGGVGKELFRKEMKTLKKQLGLKACISF